jgi:hypothetical protein
VCRHRGFIPQISTFGGNPTIGNSAFGLALSRGRGGAVAALIAGTVANPMGTLVAGCSAHLEGLVFEVLRINLVGALGAAGAGYRLVNLPVPTNPSLSGQSAHLQWAVMDPGASNGILAVSDALTIVVQ